MAKLNSAPDSVTVNTSNSAPTANAGPNQTAPVGTTVQLTGAQSTDIDGQPLSFSWSITTRPAGSAAAVSNPSAVAPNIIVDRPGSFVLQLIVNDGFVNSAPDTMTITTANTPPVANAGPDQTVNFGSTVSLNGSASSDVDGNPLQLRVVDHEPADRQHSVAFERQRRHTHVRCRSCRSVHRAIDR